MGRVQFNPATIHFNCLLDDRAFLMTVKRVAEYKRINHRETAITYCKSFAYYTEERLLGAIIFYVSMFAFFLGMFLIRYRIELILSTPLFAGFVVLYLKMGFQYNSPTQYPEKLYKERGLMAYLGLCVIFVLMLFFIDIPILHRLFQKTVV